MCYFLHCTKEYFIDYIVGSLNQKPYFVSPWPVSKKLLTMIKANTLQDDKDGILQIWRSQHLHEIHPRYCFYIQLPQCTPNQTSHTPVKFFEMETYYPYFNQQSIFTHSEALEPQAQIFLFLWIMLMSFISVEQPPFFSVCLRSCLSSLCC